MTCPFPSKVDDTHTILPFYYILAILAHELFSSHWAIMGLLIRFWIAIYYLAQLLSSILQFHKSCWIFLFKHFFESFFPLKILQNKKYFHKNINDVVWSLPTFHVVFSHIITLCTTKNENYSFRCFFLALNYLFHPSLVKNS